MQFALGNSRIAHTILIKLTLCERRNVQICNGLLSFIATHTQQLNNLVIQMIACFSQHLGMPLHLDKYKNIPEFHNILLILILSVSTVFSTERYRTQP